MTTADKLKPHNVEAEKALLGSILIDNGVFYEIELLHLIGSDFFIVKNGWVFEAMQALYQANEPIDPVTLSEKLDQAKRLDEIGGEAYLTSLMNDTPTAMHGSHYAQMIAKCANRRRQLEAIEQIAKATYDETNQDYLAQSEQVWANRLNGRSPFTRPDPWQINNLANAYEPRPPLQWVVHSLISVPSLNILYGAPGVMKSILLADMVACVVSDSPWLEPLPGESAMVQRNTIAAPVFWLDFDNGPRRTDERFEAIGRARGLGEGTPLYYTSMPEPWLDASDPGHIEMLIRRIQKLKAKIVVIDNLRVISGSLDENSAEMSYIMSNLRKVAEKCHAAVIVIHHQSKNKNATRAGDTLRGHSSIESAIDLALLVTRKEGADKVEIRSTKTRDIDVLPFAAQFAFEHKPGTVELSEARFFGVKAEDTNDSRTLEVVIKASVRTNPGVGKAKLTEVIKGKLSDVGINKIKKAIDQAAAEGKIKVKTAGPGKPFEYYPVEPIPF